MMEDLGIRLFIVAFILTAIILIKLLFRLKKGNLTESKKVNRELLPSWQPGKQSIVFFTNDSCYECEKLQKPALNLLEKQDTQIFTINASIDRTLASYFKILTVPTTIVLDNHGVSQFINHGYTSEKILSAQLKEV